MINIRSHICVYISTNHLLQQCFILDFLLVIVTGNGFFAGLFYESIKCLIFTAKSAFLRILTSTGSLRCWQCLIMR